MKFNLSASSLKIIAMLAMILDHTCHMLMPQHLWMSGIGRIAFPIFAFLLVEGFYETRDLDKYTFRLFIFALISEIPFNLAFSKKLFNPLHNNVMWTLLIGLITLKYLHIARKHKNPSDRIFSILIILGISLAISAFSNIDYGYKGILMILLFYTFRQPSFKNMLMQALGMIIINYFIMGKFSYYIDILGLSILVVHQAFALLALPLIWTYQGRKGLKSRYFKWFNYWFYPAHLLILVIIYNLKY